MAPHGGCRAAKGRTPGQARQAQAGQVGVSLNLGVCRARRPARGAEPAPSGLFRNRQCRRLPRPLSCSTPVQKPWRGPQGTVDGRHGAPGRRTGRGAVMASATTAICAGKPPMLAAGELARGVPAPVAVTSHPPRGLSTSHQQRCIIAPRLRCGRPVAAHFHPHYITGIPSAALGDRCLRVVWGPRAAGRQALGSSGLPQRRGLTIWPMSSASISAPPTRAWR